MDEAVGDLQLSCKKSPYTAYFVDFLYNRIVLQFPSL